MNREKSKKREERVLLDLFRDCFADFPKSAISEAESPDFILSSGPKKKIGVELVRLHLRNGQSDPYSYENLSGCIQMKEDKLGLYRKRRLREYWLIIAVRDPAFKSSFNLKNKLLKWDFETSFDRVFLFNPFDMDVEELVRSE
jgi:hypothetical protein